MVAVAQTEGSAGPRMGAFGKGGPHFISSLRITSIRALTATKRPSDGAAVRCPGRWRGYSGRGLRAPLFAQEAHHG